SGGGARLAPARAARDGANREGAGLLLARELRVRRELESPRQGLGAGEDALRPGRLSPGGIVPAQDRSVSRPADPALPAHPPRGTGAAAGTRRPRTGGPGSAAPPPGRAPAKPAAPVSAAASPSS